MGLVHKISEIPSGALVATGVTCAPGVNLENEKKLFPDLDKSWNLEKAPKNLEKSWNSKKSTWKNHGIFSVV